MYIKIEKDCSNNFLIIEAKDIEIRNSIFTMEYKDYIEGLVIPALAVGFEQQSFSQKAKDAIKYIFNHITWENVHPITDCDIYDWKNAKDSESSCSCALKGIIADNIGYITFGNIYVLNDKGQTIQRI